MNQFWDEIGLHWERAGNTEMSFSAEGVSIVDKVSERAMGWGAIDAIRPVQGGTVLRSGISMIVIVDQVLLNGLDPQAFRAQLDVWRST